MTPEIPPTVASPGPLSVYQQWARAFEIFASYPHERFEGVSAQHDEVFAGPDPAVVSAEHLAELEAMNWLADQQYSTFRRFT